MEEIFIEEYVEGQENEKQLIHEGEEATENVVESQPNFEKITDNKIIVITRKTNQLLKYQINDLLSQEATKIMCNTVIQDEKAVQREYIKILLKTQQELQNYLDQLRDRLSIDCKKFKQSEYNVTKLNEINENIEQHVKLWVGLFETISEKYQIIFDKAQMNEKNSVKLLKRVDDATESIMNEFEMKRSQIQLNFATASIPSPNNNRQTKLKELISNHKRDVLIIAEKMQELNKNNEINKNKLLEKIQESHNICLFQMNKNEMYKDEIKSLQDKLQQIQKEKNLLDDSKNHLQNGNKSREDKIVNLKHTYSKISQEIDFLKIELSKIENDIVSFETNNNLKEIHEELENIENERDSLNQINKHFKMKLEEKANIYSTQQANNDEKKTVILNNKIVLKNLQLVLEKMNQDYNNQSNNRIGLEKHFNHLSYEELLSINKKHSQVQEKFESKICEKRQELEKKKQEGAETSSALKELLNTQQAKFTQLQNECENSSQELKKIQTNVVNLNSEIDSLRMMFKLRVKYLDKIKEEALNSGKFKVKKSVNRTDTSSVSPVNKRVRFNDIVDIKSATETESSTNGSQER